jgi:hypothetical protein
MTAGCRKLHNEELPNLYFWTHIIRMKSRRIRWAGYEALMAGKGAYRIFAWRPTGRREYNIKTCLKETGWECGLDSSGSRQRLVACSCEHSNEALGSIKCREFHT